MYDNSLFPVFQEEKICTIAINIKKPAVMQDCGRIVIKNA